MASLSCGKYPIVAPYSGAIFAMVALSANESEEHPGPKNYTNLPTTPRFLNIFVTCKTRSVAVTCSLNDPVSLKPITSGKTMEIGWPSITAYASIPPTPQPTTPKPLIIVVCESVPTTESGYTIPFAFSRTTLAKNSRFTWWTIPLPGGTIEKLLNAVEPHFKNSNLS